jgi:hypothetical protein
MGLLDLLKAAISGESTVKLRDASGSSAPMEIPPTAPNLASDPVSRFIARADALTPEQWQAVVLAAQATDADPAQAARLRVAEEHARAFAREPGRMNQLMGELSHVAMTRHNAGLDRAGILAEGRAAVALAVRSEISAEDFSLLYGPFESLIPLSSLEDD